MLARVTQQIEFARRQCNLFSIAHDPTCLHVKGEITDLFRSGISGIDSSQQSANGASNSAKGKRLTKYRPLRRLIRAHDSSTASRAVSSSTGVFRTARREACATPQIPSRPGSINRRMRNQNFRAKGKKKPFFARIRGHRLEAFVRSPLARARAVLASLN